MLWPMRILTVPQQAQIYSASLRSISSRRRGRSFGLQLRPWPFPFRRGWRFGGRRLDRRRDLGFGHDHPIEEGRAFNPLAAATKSYLHKAVNVGLLRFDLFAKFGDHAVQFCDHGFRVGQLLAQVVRVVSQRHILFNTAPRSG
jgi:hypothetical protein